MLSAAEDLNQTVALCVSEAAWHLDAEFKNKTAAVMVGNECRKGVIVVDGHSLLGEHFARLGADHFVSSEFNRLPIKRLKLDWLRAKSLLQRDLMVVDQIVS